MGETTEPRWLAWAKRVGAIGRTGLAYTEGGPFDRQRYREMEELAAEMLAALSDGGEPGPLRELVAGDGSYPTPKLGVRAVVERDGRVLLVRESEDGLWTLPGGWVDVGRSPGEAAVEETEHEAGLRVRAAGLLAALDGRRRGNPPRPFDLLKLFVRCEPLDDAEPRADGVEATDARFFAPDDLPPLSAERVPEEEMAFVLRLLREPDGPAVFD